MQFLHLLLFVASSAFAAAAENNVISKSEADAIFKGLQEPGNCDAGQKTVGLLKGAAHLGKSGFAFIVGGMCKLARKYDGDVCDGAVNLEADAAVHQLNQMSHDSKTAGWLSATLFGQCAYPAVDPYKYTFPKPKPKAVRPAPSGKQPIQIVQYSDTHVDPFYTEGSNKDCNKPSCCRPYTDKDKPGVTKNPAGPFGEVKCDSPLKLEQSMYLAIKKHVPDAKFILFTGDIVDHVLWKTTQAQNTLDIANAYSRMDDSFRLVYGTVGNHEASPVNLFRPRNQGSETSWIYNTLASAWTKWIGKAVDDVKKSGYYVSKYPGGKLRIISLNTNFYYILNLWAYKEPMERDPDDQLNWLVRELQDAEDAGDRVYIIGHTPMGASDTFHGYSNYFNQIVSRYEYTIAALFFGHTHADELEIGYSDYNVPRSFSTAAAVSYICPSLYPGDGNPAFRVYSVDPDTFAVLDSVTYYADMKDPNYQKGPVWKKLYSAKDTYGPMVLPPLGPKDELSPAFWHNVTVAFEESSSNLKTYMDYKSRGYTPAPPCNGECQKKEICQIRAMRSEDNCYVPVPGMNLFKRAEPDDNDDGEDDDNSDDDMHDHGDCGMSMMKESFGFMVHNREAFDLLVNAVNGTATNGTATGPTNGTAPGNSTMAAPPVDVHRAALKARDEEDML